jgi:hypothetical protein
MTIKLRHVSALTAVEQKPRANVRTVKTDIFALQPYPTGIRKVRTDVFKRTKILPDFTVEPKQTLLDKFNRSNMLNLTIDQVVFSTPMVNASDNYNTFLTMTVNESSRFRGSVELKYNRVGIKYLRPWLGLITPIEGIGSTHGYLETLQQEHGIYLTTEDVEDLPLENGVIQWKVASNSLYFLPGTTFPEQNSLTNLFSETRLDGFSYPPKQPLSSVFTKTRLEGFKERERDLSELFSKTRLSGFTKPKSLAELFGKN